MKILMFFFTLLITGFIPNKSNCQVLLQLEINREVEAVKFAPGQSITFKAKSFETDWQTRKIEKLLIEENIILFEDGMTELTDITHLRLTNETAAAVGKLFQGFGAGWIVFGGLAHIATDYKFTWGTFAIGAVATGLGWLFNKVVAKKTFKMGKNANLRIIDISFPDPANIPTPVNGMP